MLYWYFIDSFNQFIWTHLWLFNVFTVSGLFVFSTRLLPPFVLSRGPASSSLCCVSSCPGRRLDTRWEGGFPVICIKSDVLISHRTGIHLFSSCLAHVWRSITVNPQLLCGVLPVELMWILQTWHLFWIEAENGFIPVCKITDSFIVRKD